MTSRKELIQDCIELQSAAYTRLATNYGKLDTFKDKSVRIAYCCNLVLDDLEALHEKRYFNCNPKREALLPDPESDIPLGFCMYLEKIPVAYTLGEISIERKAFEVHFIETSNFATGLNAWINYIISILIGVKTVLKNHKDIDIDNVVFVSPTASTIQPLAEMGFDYINDYYKAQNAAVFKIKV